MRAVLGLVCACFVALPSIVQARQFFIENHGTLAAAATYTSQEVNVSSALAPMTVVVGYTSVNTATATISIEVSMDKTNWAVPGLVAGTPATTLNEIVTGNGSYMVFPITLGVDPGGPGTVEMAGHLGPWMRVKLVNNSGTTSITNLRCGLYGN